MNILDSLLGAVSNSHTESNLVSSVLGLINEPQAGGLMGLVEKIAASGLTEQVNSWVSTGENLPVTGSQIQAALGSPMIQELATNMGIDSNDVANNLAQLLPVIIDHLTPEGQVSNNDNLQTLLMGLNSLVNK